MNDKWPDDADGDVLRSLEADGFDFTRSYPVDFGIDFANWPPEAAAVDLLKSRYSDIDVVEPDEEDLEEGEANGWISIQIEGIVSYEFVTKTQEALTELMRPFGGWCDSWGVMQE